jgi:serine/threonine-protein kinase
MRVGTDNAYITKAIAQDIKNYLRNDTARADRDSALATTAIYDLFTPPKFRRSLLMAANALSISMPPGMLNPRGRVLCVDDEPSVLRALTWLLEKEFQVVTTASANAALKLIPDGDFDVVISDQHMPEMYGVDFLNQVRTTSPRSMRILLSGYSDMQGALRSVNESAIFRYITKPWNVAELTGIVGQAADIARQQINPIPTNTTACESTTMRQGKILVLDDEDSTHSAVEMNAGDLGEIIHATSPVEAFRLLDSEKVGVIVAERMLGSMDLTRLLCLLKRQHPAIVSIVLSKTIDSELLTKLINQGQLYRFLNKPVTPVALRLGIKDALLHHEALINAPTLAHRYQVDALTAEDRIALQTQASLALASQDRESTNAGKQDSRLGEARNFMRRMFGG